MTRRLVDAVACCGGIQVDGDFFRHTSIRVDGLRGSDRGGRWGAQGSHSVLYLGRPVESVVVEAYRHLVDPVEGMRAELVAPRRLSTVRVSVANVLDLRGSANRRAVDLAISDVESEIGDYERCQHVAGVAYQLDYHGIIAPAATRRGETLALFDRRLTAAELPDFVDEVIWPHLPPDPRTDAPPSEDEWRRTGLRPGEVRAGRRAYLADAATRRRQSIGAWPSTTQILRPAAAPPGGPPSRP